MFKRHQVLLTDWLTDYAKYIAKEYDVSFSEVIRLSMCLYFGEMVSQIHPEYKFPLTKEKVAEIIEKISAKKLPEEEIHKLISQAYFEARKAIEYRQSKVKEKKG